MGATRVVVVDDDHWKRTAMARELAADPRVEVVAAIDQDTAVAWPIERWNGVDVALVDVFDETAPAELGTDVYSGIAVLVRLAGVPTVRTIAVTPQCQHPVVQLRIHQAETNYLYHRWEINGPEMLVSAVLDPSEDHRPLRPPEDDLIRVGAETLRANRLVGIYLRSKLYGFARPEIGRKSLPVGVRYLERFRAAALATGFLGGADPTGADPNKRLPRWPKVRDILLLALGRRDAPATEVDRTDLTSAHRLDAPPE